MDCLDGMKMIEDHSIDMILCDLPYAVTDNDWDSLIPLDKIWANYQRLIKENGAILFTAVQPFAAKLIVSKLNWFKYELIWRKPNGSNFLNAHKMPMRNHESILVFYNKLPTYNPQMRKGEPYVSKRSSASSNYEQKGIVTTYNRGDRFPLTVLDYNYDTSKLHPTQKPLKLFEYLIKTYTDEGQTVLDPTMGSGTTAEACQNIRRQYIGFETDADYYKIIQNRLHSNCRKLIEWETAGVTSEAEFNKWAVSDMM